MRTCTISGSELNFLAFLELCSERKIRFILQGDQFKVQAPKETLTSEMAAAMRLFKPEIIDWLRLHADGNSGAAAELAPIPVVARAGSLRSSPGQEAMWLAHRDERIGAAYHFVRVLHLHGALDVDAVQESFNDILLRHETLRTTLSELDGEIVQQVVPMRALKVESTDLSGMAPQEREVAANDIVEQVGSMPFDLARDVMLRVRLIREAPDRHQLIVVMHHIATDGWSLGIIVKEFTWLYGARVKGEPALLPPLPIQYADYSAWIREKTDAAQASSALAYWREQLHGVPEVHGLPLDRPRSKMQSFRGRAVVTRLSAGMGAALQSLALSHGGTLYMAIECAFAILLSRYSGNDDIVIGTPAANRTHRDLDALVGYFVNLVPLRQQIDTQCSFRILLERARDCIVSALEQQHLPFDRVVQNVVGRRDASYNPLVQIVFAFQNNDIPELNLPGVSCTISQSANTHSFFDLLLEATQTPSGIDLRWEYATDLFDESTI
ncbi:MAG TPA: condensation domain-containing protein, partial [Noviherbaspirillum sp.]